MESRFQLVMEMRHALRRLRRSPGFATVALLTLALGLGATITLFTLVHGILLKPLPYPEPERIVRLFEVNDKGERRDQMSDPNFADVSRLAESLEATAQYRAGHASVVAGDTPTRVTVAQVSHGFFDVLGVRPTRGRLFDPDEQQPGAAPSALVSHEYWRRYLDAAPDPGGRTLRYGDNVVAVVGVLPPGFDFPDGADLWLPRELEPSTPSRTALNKRVLARLAPGVGLEAARRELTAVAGRLHEVLGDETWMHDVAVVPLQEDLVGVARPPLLLLFAASGLLLLIACSNVAHLFLARAASRRRELAVRVALGAGRGRLILQSLAEALLLAILGSALGLLLARWGVEVARHLGIDAVPRLSEIHVGGAVFAFTLGLSLMVALGLTLLATWHSTGAEVRATLATGGRNQVRGASRGRNALVVIQVALTLMLLVGTGLLLRSFRSLLTVEPGFVTEGALVVDSGLPYPDDDAEAEAQRRFHERLSARLREQPGVAAVGGIDALPLTVLGANGVFLKVNGPDEITDWASLEAALRDPSRQGHAEYRRVVPGYFEAMGIPLVRGRGIDARDRADRPPVAVVSEVLAATAWPGEDPVGRLVQFGNMDGDLRPFHVVGVVGDVRDASLEADPRPTFYANAFQRPRALTGPFNLVVVPADRTGLTAADIERLVHAIDPQVAPKVRSLNEIYAGSLAERRFQLRLLGAFGLSALLLAVVGVYGVISFEMARRVREVGLRMALGATFGTVVRLVLRSGLGPTALGVILGLMGTLALSRGMRGLLYNVSATDPATFLVVPCVLGAAAVVACILPAYRATRVDPVTALRTE